MSLESRFESALNSQLTRHGLSHFLGGTRTLIALIGSEDSAIRAKPSFDRLRAALGIPQTFLAKRLGGDQWLILDS